jgi:hypothetical protein
VVTNIGRHGARLAGCNPNNHGLSLLQRRAVNPHQSRLAIWRQAQVADDDINRQIVSNSDRGAKREPRVINISAQAPSDPKRVTQPCRLQLASDKSDNRND